tara:strand:+ start:407 stop:1066 length:660 start_codon:yes stop_codon:yes gene_type:complete
MRKGIIPVMLVLGVMSFLASSVAQAHPHGWIDLSVRIITDDEGRVSGLHQTWQMDPFYSLVVFEELQQMGEVSLEEGLDQLGTEIRDNLTGQHYLSNVTIDDEPQAFGEVSEYTLMEHGGRLTFMFILPLETPTPLAGSLLAYQVFDPTYYIEVVHQAENNQPREDALILNGVPSCELAILPADPDPDVVMKAAMLDVDESGEPGLGRFFAETGRVDCR